MKKKPKRVATPARAKDTTVIAAKVLTPEAMRVELERAEKIRADLDLEEMALMDSAVVKNPVGSTKPERWTRVEPGGVAMSPLIMVNRKASWICAHYWLGANWRELARGTPVLVRRDDGSMLETVTSAAPYDAGGQPLVRCDGLDEGYHLRHVFLRRNAS